MRTAFKVIDGGLSEETNISETSLNDELQRLQKQCEGLIKIAENMPSSETGLVEVLQVIHRACDDLADIHKNGSLLQKWKADSSVKTLKWLFDQTSHALYCNFPEENQGFVKAVKQRLDMMWMEGQIKEDPRRVTAPVRGEEDSLEVEPIRAL